MFALVLVTAGPVWDQIKEFVQALPAYWDELQQTDWFQSVTSAADFDDKVRDALKDFAAGLPDTATTLLGIAGGIFGSMLSLVTLTFLCAVPADGAPGDHRLAVRLHPAGRRRSAGGRWSRTRSPPCPPR